ncbi:ABC transporter ATP-binding protein [Streptomyces stramineus]
MRDLAVSFTGRGRTVTAVHGLSFDLARGEVLGLVGESGSGKSTVGLAAMGLHDAARTRVSGSISVGGTEIVGAPDSAVRALRGARIAMVFQDALAALSPFHPVGAQIAEAYRIHSGAGRAAGRARAAEMLDRVGIPATRARDYPHQFSGGMRQRVMIAMALVNAPDVLIADEPTTALDARVQRQVLSLLAELREESGTAVLLITHDVGVVAGTCDRMLVMRNGHLVESGPADTLLTNAQHPYTRALIDAAPTLETVPGVRLPVAFAAGPDDGPAAGGGVGCGAGSLVSAATAGRPAADAAVPAGCRRWGGLRCRFLLSAATAGRPTADAAVPGGLGRWGRPGGGVSGYRAATGRAPGAPRRSGQGCGAEPRRCRAGLGRWGRPGGGVSGYRAAIGRAPGASRCGGQGCGAEPRRSRRSHRPPRRIRRTPHPLGAPVPPRAGGPRGESSGRGR